MTEKCVYSWEKILNKKRRGNRDDFNGKATSELFLASISSFDGVRALAIYPCAQDMSAPARVEISRDQTELFWRTDRYLCNLKLNFGRTLDSLLLSSGPYDVCTFLSLATSARLPGSHTSAAPSLMRTSLFSRVLTNRYRNELRRR